VNETELNELLDQWEAPPVPPSLRQNVRAGYAAHVGHNRTRRSPMNWLAAFTPASKRTLFAGTAMGAGAFFLLLVTQAFPQTLRMAPFFHIPYTVDSEFVEYPETGPPKVVMYLTSYSDHGTEINLSSSMPGDSVKTAIRRTLDVLGFLYYKIAGRSEPAHPDFLRAGCVNGPVFKRETILGFQTTVVETRLSDRHRITSWMSPDLSCFALKLRIEEQRADGTYRIVSEKHALKVTFNH
jgi:hypothetical protein